MYSKNNGEKLYVSLIIATNGRLTGFTEEKVLLLRVLKNIAIKLPKLKVFGFLKAGLAPKFPGPVGIGIVRKKTMLIIMKSKSKNNYLLQTISLFHHTFPS